ncbi:MAG: hypothetical protein AAF916_07025 [Planctomycetota bacterium]
MANVTMLNNRSGFETHSRVAHVAAADAFGDEASPTPANSDTEGLWDHSTLKATVAVELDQRLRVVRDVDGGDIDRVLYLEVPGAAMHLCDPAAVVQIQPDRSALVTAQEAGIDRVLRDDGDRLRSIADAAAVWYGRERNRLEVTYYAARTGFVLGTLITEIAPVPGTGIVPINSTITSIEHDLEHGTTKIITDTGDPDFAGIR